MISKRESLLGNEEPEFWGDSQGGSIEVPKNYSFAFFFIQGMRIALTEQEFEAQLESAKREAMKSFGDEVMLLGGPLGGSVGGY